MGFSEKIIIYVLRGGEHADRKLSDERILCCAALFIESGGICCEALPSIKRRGGKKPCFEKDIGIYFSVSHSGDYWACAVSKQEIGIDIQKQTGKYSRGIAKRFFHSDEHKYLEANDFNDFFKIWTAKESYVKFTGQGIKGFTDFSVVTDGHISEDINGVHIHFINFDPDYCLCVCAAEIIESGVNIKFPY